MRPDLDDFEELNEEGAPRSRAMSWLVLIVAVGGFAALAYYAYHSGSQSVRDGQVMIVSADQNAIKSAPADAGGEEFPNQDKTIYDAIDPESAENQPVEKLLPEPENPVIPEPAVENAAPESAAAPVANTYVNKSLTGSEAPVDPVDAQSMKQGGPDATPTAETKPVAKAEPAPAPVPAAVKAEPAPAPVAKVEPAAEKPAGTPEFVNVKPAKPVAKPAAAKPAAPAATGNYKIQLGAYKSDAEARAQWTKIASKHSDVLKGSPVIVKAILPNGTFYRLRAGGFASPDTAKAACAKLSAKGQACFYAGK